MGISDGESNRHGGVEHRYWARRIADHVRANGYEVSQEVPVGAGKTIDLVATRHGKRIAFEIETGKSDAAANVRKCLKADMDRVVVVTTSRPGKARIELALSMDPRVTCVAPDEALCRDWLAPEQPRPLHRDGAQAAGQDPPE